jgi:oxygen-independent coproporphyrinogen-3 oxidase
MKKLVQTIKKAFSISQSAEITFEANPGTLTREKVDAFYKLGFNRVSLGLQSIHKNEMEKLGRIHNYDDFLSTYHLARRLGIKNINVDLMYGIPDQTMGSFGKTLESVIALEPEHLSLYGLILEEGTPLYNARETLAFPGEDDECDMYYLATDMMRKSGYLHYEISNYAKEGYSSRHNMKYWHADEYIGVGLAAHSYYSGVRYGNSGDISAYLSGDYAKYDMGEMLDNESLAYEYVMLHLRLAEGFDPSKYRERFGVDFRQGREEILSKMEKSGLLTMENNRISLTERGFYVSNNILTELL